MLFISELHVISPGIVGVECLAHDGLHGVLAGGDNEKLLFRDGLQSIDGIAQIDLAMSDEDRLASQRARKMAIGSTPLRSGEGQSIMRPPWPRRLVAVAVPLVAVPVAREQIGIARRGAQGR